MAAVTEAFGFDSLVAVLAVSADKDVPGMLAELEPAVSSLVVTRNSAARSMDPGELERLAAGVFGPDRVFAVPRLDDAIDTAVRRTRSFARRQRMWFRRDPRITWLGATDNPCAALPAVLATWSS